MMYFLVNQKDGLTRDVTMPLCLVGSFFLRGKKED